MDYVRDKIARKYDNPAHKKKKIRSQVDHFQDNFQRSAARIKQSSKVDCLGGQRSGDLSGINRENTRVLIEKSPEDILSVVVINPAKGHN